MTIHDPQLSRRSILKGAAGLTIAFYLPRLAKAQTAIAQPETFAPNAFIRITPDNVVTVLSKHLEMGQGPYTGLTTIVAEELDADWSQMRVASAPANAKLYGNSIFGGLQGTGGSSAIANSYEQLRQAGATARAMLVAAAAAEWNVPAGEITVERGAVKHAASNRQATFGQLAEAAARLRAAPGDVKLKDPSQFRLIGHDGVVKKLDVPGKTNGTAKFTIDQYEPGMLTVVVAHPPRFGATVAKVDDSAARKVAGVVEVKTLPTGVAVYANGMWPAIKGREALRITWDESKAEKRGSAELFDAYRRQARTPGKVAGARGDAAAALKKARKVIEVEFVFPYLAHAPMEPLDGFMMWDGTTAKARFGSQIQTLDQGAIAGILGIKPEQVQIETLLAGGSFGRRAQATSHLAAELAQAVKAIGPGKPVKLVWTREDDIRGGYYRPMFVHRLSGAVEDGKIVAWSNTIVGQSFMAGTPFAAMIKDGIDPTMVGGAKEIFYDVADFNCDVHMTQVGVPTLWWRSVEHTHTGYAVECFVDELLQVAGKDPVAGRLALMAKHPRAAGVLKAVAELAKWSGTKPAEGRARGVAVVESFDSFIAQIAEVSIGDGGEPKVHKVWCAVDCGVAINPDIIRAQMEGGIGYGLGHILYAEVPLDAGHVVPGNFDGYRSLRINEMPEIEVTIVKSSEKPTGVGEPGVPPIGPAVANALARLGRERPRRLPMVRGTV